MTRIVKRQPISWGFSAVQTAFQTPYGDKDIDVFLPEGAYTKYSVSRQRSSTGLFEELLKLAGRNDEEALSKMVDIIEADRSPMEAWLNFFSRTSHNPFRRAQMLAILEYYKPDLHKIISKRSGSFRSDIGFSSSVKYILNQLWAAGFLVESKELETRFRFYILGRFADIFTEVFDPKLRLSDDERWEMLLKKADGHELTSYSDGEGPKKFEFEGFSIRVTEIEIAPPPKMEVRVVFLLLPTINWDSVEEYKNFKALMAIDPLGFEKTWLQKQRER